MQFQMIADFLNTLENGVILVDEDLHISFWNHWLVKHTGIATETIIDKRLHDFFPEVKVGTLQRKIKSALALGTPTVYSVSSGNNLFNIEQKSFFYEEFRYMQQNVSIIPMPDKKLVMLVIYDQTDLLEKKQRLSSQVEEIKELNKALESESKVIDEYVLMIRCDYDEKIVTCSQALKKLLGVEKAAAGADFNEVFPHTKEDDPRGDNRDILKFTLKGHKPLWLLVQSKVIDMDNKMYIYILQDITDHILFERQQKRMLEQSRNAAMGEMLSMIGHQWRQPLAYVCSVVSNIKVQESLDMLDSAVLQNDLSKIETTAKELSQTITDFSGLFKPVTDKTDVDLNILIKKSLSLVLPTISDSGINIELQESLVVQAKVYTNELIQVLVNIIKNAIDELIAQKIEKGKVQISLYEENCHAFIKIMDNAGGIPDEIKDKIFEPYFSTKSHNGTGLGLYMCKIIVEEHLKGKIELLSDPPHTQFTISFPLS